MLKTTDFPAVTVNIMQDIKKLQLISYIKTILFCEMLYLNMQIRLYVMLTLVEFRRNLQTQTDKVKKRQKCIN